MSILKERLFDDTVFGKAALKSFGEVPENFYLYEAGWEELQHAGYGQPVFFASPDDKMHVKGACFRFNKDGKSTMIKGTEKHFVITRLELCQIEGDTNE